MLENRIENGQRMRLSGAGSEGYAGSLSGSLNHNKKGKESKECLHEKRESSDREVNELI